MTISRVTGLKRLLKLAAFLRTLPRERFDYTQWVGDDWQGKPDLSCGTTACAMGWAATMPEFRRLGLRLKWDKERLDGGISYKGQFHDIYDIASEMFAIAWTEAYYLFSPYNDKEEKATPKQVAAKIEKYVKSAMRYTKKSKR